jgi:hypothetical protein
MYGKLYVFLLGSQSPFGTIQYVSHLLIYIPSYLRLITRYEYFDEVHRFLSKNFRAEVKGLEMNRESLPS